MCQRQSLCRPSLTFVHPDTDPYHSREALVFTAATTTTNNNNHTTMDNYHSSDSIPEGLPSRDFTRSRQSSTSSERSCEGMSADETRDLWRCMLELQERYGCYNSTRVSLAVGAGDEAVDLMPSRFIIDTLNHSLIDLPEEGWEMLDSQYLRHDHEVGTPKEKQKSSRRLWHRR